METDGDVAVYMLSWAIHMATSIVKHARDALKFPMDGDARDTFLTIALIAERLEDVLKERLNEVVESKKMEG